MFRRSAVEMRVIILAPIGRDAGLLANTLEELKIEAAIARDWHVLLEMLQEGVGAAIVAEEALSRESIDALSAWLLERSATAPALYLRGPAARERPRKR